MNMNDSNEDITAMKEQMWAALKMIQMRMNNIPNLNQEYKDKIKGFLVCCMAYKTEKKNDLA